VLGGKLVDGGAIHPEVVENELLRFLNSYCAKKGRVWSRKEWTSCA
jgi:hypothetical protein